MTKRMRELVAAGRVELPPFGEVRRHSEAHIGWIVVDGADVVIETIDAFLRDLSLSDMNPLTTRSYGVRPTSLVAAPGPCRARLGACNPRRS